MVNWLERHNTPHRNRQNEVLEEAYRQLNLVANRIPPPAMNQDEIMRQIMAHQAQRQIQRDQQRNERIQARRIQIEEQRRAEFLPLVQQGFAPVEQRIDQVAERQIAQIRELNQDIAPQIHALQPVINFVEGEIAELGQRERALELQNNRAQEGIVDLHNTHQQLELEKTQLKKQVKENEKAGLKLLGQALLTIASCALGTVVIQCALAGMTGAASVVVQPMANGYAVQATVAL